MKAYRHTTTAGLACAAALGLFAAAIPALVASTPAQAVPIVVPSQDPIVRPVNIALTGTATASSIESALPGNTAAMAIDGNSSTRWSSNYADATWLQVELAAAGPIDHVKLTWPNAAAREYKLQTSVDGTAWTDVKTVTSTTGPGRTDEVVLGVANAKFIRMMGVKRWSTFGFSISEFEVYDKAQPIVPDSLALVPAPVASAGTDKGTFALTPGSRIVAAGAAVEAANYFAAKARSSTGFALPVVTGSASATDVEITVAPDSSEARPESYTLQADARGVKIAANTGAGAFNGVQTLRQLLPQWIESGTVVNTPWTVDGVVVSDYPRYEYRGIQIDVARSFYTVDEMKEHIDNAAQFKFNRLHVHLTDDQGWRIVMDEPESNPSGIKYSDLTEISGETAMTNNDAGVMQGTEFGHTGFYTKADYKEIVRYAGENGMTVVPEIDMPGHTTAALHAIPQLNSAGSAPKPLPGQTTAPHQGSGNVGGSTFDADNPATYEFTKEVLGQLQAMTPGPYLHIGGDESHVTPGDKYRKMIDAFTSQVADLGKTAIGWNEAAGALPANSVVQYWWGSREATASSVLNRNLKVILSPAEKTYIPQKQDNSNTAGGTWACGGACTLQNHYDWDPGKYLPGVGDDKVLGVETVQWGEWLRGMPQTEQYQYPRTLATAEVAWSPQANKDYADFSKRTAKLGGRMELQDLNHFATAGLNWATSPAAPAEVPTPLDPANLPSTSPSDLQLPSGERAGGDFAMMANLPASAWLRATIQSKDVAGSVSGAWVRTNAAGQAPLTLPQGLAGGDYVATVQNAAGDVLGFAAFAVGVVPTTAPPTTAPPTVEPTTAPPTVAPTTAPPTVEPTTAPPTVEPTTAPPTTEPTVPATNEPVQADAAGELSSGTVAAGQVLSISGRNFKPGTLATFTLYSDPVDLGTEVVGESGTATLTTTIPVDVPAGDHTVVITGTGQDGTDARVSIALVVTGAESSEKPSATVATGSQPAVATTAAVTTAAATDTLAATGSKGTVLGGFALLLLLGGGIAFAVSRRRSTARH